MLSPTSFPRPIAGGESLAVVLQFAPEDDLSGTAPQVRRAELSVVAAGALGPDGGPLPASILSLAGAGVLPTLQMTPATCDFSNPLDLCGCTLKPDGGREAGAACFRIDNTGAEPATLANGACTVDHPSFGFQSCWRQLSDGGVLALSGPLGPGESALCYALHTDAGEYASSRFSCDFGEVGSTNAWLVGGLPPCLDTEPQDLVTFGPGPDVRPVVVHNRRRLMDGGTSCAGCGRLSLTDGTFDPPSPQFRVLDGGFPTSLEACDQRIFQLWRSGSAPELGEWLLASNDPNYSPAKALGLVREGLPMPVPACSLCTNAQLLDGDPNCRGGKRSLRVSRSATNPKIAWVSCANSLATLADGGTGRPLECGIAVIPGAAQASDLTTRSGGACQRSSTTDAGWFPYEDGAGNVHLCQVVLPAPGEKVQLNVEISDASGRVPLRDTCTVQVDP